MAGRAGGFIGLSRSMQGFASAAIVATAVPEPESWLLLAAGGGMLGWVARRRRQSVNA